MLSDDAFNYVKSRVPTVRSIKVTTEPSYSNYGRIGLSSSGGPATVVTPWFNAPTNETHFNLNNPYTWLSNIVVWYYKFRLKRITFCGYTI